MLHNKYNKYNILEIFLIYFYVLGINIVNIGYAIKKLRCKIFDISFS